MKKDVQIGFARPEELDDIWELYQRVFLDTYIDEEAGITEAKLKDFLSADAPHLPKNWQTYLETPSRQRTVYVARDHSKIIGMVSPMLLHDRPRVAALYVAPEVQGRGVGTKLMQRALVHFGNVDVDIGIASHIFEQRRKFYESFGFRVVNPNRVKQYQGDPMSYVEMVWPAAKSSE